MKPHKVILLLIVSSCYNTVVKCDDLVRAKLKSKTDSSDEDNSGVFKATNEWQTLRKDQAIPRGLHVSVNLQTGERKAKLLSSSEVNRFDSDEDENEDERHDLYAVTESDEERRSSYEGISLKELKFFLQKLEGNERASPGGPDEELDKVKRRFRSYEELKKELNSLQTSVKTDMELMNELLESYKLLVEKKANPSLVEPDEDLEEQELNILTDLEFLVHQIDNAREFAKSGLSDVVFPSLNSTSPKLRYEAAKLFGSAVQSNPTAQIAALEAGSVTVLLRSIALDNSAIVRSGALYGLSCLVRRFPAAQARFVERGGLQVMANLFESDTSDQLRLQIKVITLINDLILEKRDTEEIIASNSTNYNSSYGIPSKQQLEEAKEKLRQYNTIALEKKLKQLGWCQLLTNLLLKQEMVFTRSRTDDDLNLHDTVEKITSAMLSMASYCSTEFENRSVWETIETLVQRYRELSSKEIDEMGYFSGLYEQLVRLAQKINATDKPEKPIKDEF